MRRIVVKDYQKKKEWVDEFCKKNICGYEIRKDGSAVIILD